ncbi:MAG TPA: bifunctional adenosylcobinamide kinase/adenosylcobinamide-phosphate guanylyltransferase [Acidimicrobiia bacterium]|nr:bifunctional adenosylcobinamide kinase/adenosylcobinamide-phosphate guanylyltransferase [Acidimicrobiia bacterium]
MITLVLGGTRSGKSEVGERIARDLAGETDTVTYVATATTTPGDAAFHERIARHRARRPSTWTTVESGPDLPGVVAGCAGVVLVDSIGAWVAACDFRADVDALCAALRARTAPTVVVSEEVGLGVHAPTALGVQFADALGDANRALARVAHHALLVVAGRTLVLDDPDTTVVPRA